MVAASWAVPQRGSRARRMLHFVDVAQLGDDHVGAASRRVRVPLEAAPPRGSAA